MLSIYICEDNPMQLAQLEDIVQKYVMMENLDMRIRICTTDPYVLLKDLEDTPQTHGLFFLDVDLKSDLGGIQLGGKIRDLCLNSKIVFVTTHTELLSLTFTYKVEALDYIPKDDPDVMQKRICDALNRAYQHYLKKDQENASHIQLKINGQRRFFPLAEILFFETASTPHKIKLHCIHSGLEFYGKINEILELSPDFVQIHQSFVVNHKNIAQINSKQRTVTMINGETCFASARLFRNLKNTL